MTAAVENDDKSNSGSRHLKPSRKTHRFTYLVVFLVGIVLLMMNLPGQVVRGLVVSNTAKSGLQWELDRHFEHGWPITYSLRKPIEWGSRRPSLWKFNEGVVEFRFLPLLADLVISVGILFVVGIVSESYLRSAIRPQVTLRGALIAITVFTVACGWYAAQRAGRNNDHRVLDEITRNSHSAYGVATDVYNRVEWSEGGPSWLLELFEENLARGFDRVSAIETERSELAPVLKLRHLKILRIRDSLSRDELALLEGLSELEALEFSCRIAADDRNRTIELPRLSNLRAIDFGSYSSRSCRFGGLENLPRLEILITSGRDINDDTLAAIGQLSNLVFLEIEYSRITDEGMRHLRSLGNLEVVQLDSNDISDNGVEHVAGLHMLQKLTLNGCTKISDASIPVLSNLRNLNALELRGTSVTKEGIAELQQALPNCSTSDGS